MTPSRYLDLIAFARESNTIEGIRREVTDDTDALIRFLDSPGDVPALIAYVAAIQPDAIPRFTNDVPGVRVGNHVAPPSGPHIQDKLAAILTGDDPYRQHLAYERLHPFTDGNGRSGRALFLRTCNKHDAKLFARTMKLGFLHSWYYLSLSERDDE